MTDFESEFWYVLFSSAYFSNTLEKKLILPRFFTHMINLIPIKEMKRKALNVLSLMPITNDVLISNGSVMSWLSLFKERVSGDSNLPTISKSPKLFGGHWWFIIHILSICNTLNQKVDYVEMIKLLVYLLPCHACSEHAKAYVFEINPIEFHTSEYNSLLKWSYQFHEYANDNTMVEKSKRPSWRWVERFYFNLHKSY